MVKSKICEESWGMRSTALRTPLCWTSADLRCVRTHRKGNMDHVFGGAEIGQDSTSIQQLQRDSPLHGSGRGYALRKNWSLSARERDTRHGNMPGDQIDQTQRSHQSTCPVALSAANKNTKNRKCNERMRKKDKGGQKTLRNVEL
jgi:hypothetical protein